MAGPVFAVHEGRSPQNHKSAVVREGVTKILVAGEGIDDGNTTFSVMR
jgi:hypothetical protein